MWTGLFGTEVLPHDDFFDLGGDSLKVVDAVIAARQRGINVRSSAVFRNPTPARLAESLTVGAARPAASAPAVLGAAGQGAAEGAAQPSPGGAGPDQRYLVPIAEGGAAEPLLLVHSDHLTAAEREAARSWASGRPVHGLLAPGARGTAAWTGSLGELAERYADEVLRVQPDGPCFLAGVGSGAVVAFELAHILRRRSRRVALLALVKPPASAGPRPADFDEALRTQLARVTARFGIGSDESGEEVLLRLRAHGWYEESTGTSDLPRLQRASAALEVALASYRPEPYDGRVVLFQDDKDAESTDEFWGPVIADCRTEWFEYGVASLRPVLTDARTAAVMSGELAW